MKKIIEDSIVIGGFTFIASFMAYASFASDDVSVEEVDIHAINARQAMQYMHPPITSTERIRDTEITDILADNLEDDAKPKPTHHSTSSTNATKTTKIKKGQTLYAVARAYKLNPKKLMRINKCGKCNQFKVGDTVKLY